MWLLNCLEGSFQCVCNWRSSLKWSVAEKWVEERVIVVIQLQTLMNFARSKWAVPQLRMLKLIEIRCLVVDQVPLSQFAFVCLRFNESKHSFLHSVYSETSINDTQVFTKVMSVLCWVSWVVNFLHFARWNSAVVLFYLCLTSSAQLESLFSSSSLSKSRQKLLRLLRICQFKSNMISILSRARSLCTMHVDNSTESAVKVELLIISGSRSDRKW